jgi:serine/threonine protein phosphatase PrpC
MSVGDELPEGNPILVRDSIRSFQGPFFEAALVCQKGKRAGPNQDLCGIVLRKGLGLAIGIADGMGGHHGGEVASWLALEAALKAVASCAGNLSPKERLVQAFLAAYASMEEEIQKKPQLEGMGTTLTLVWVEDARGFFGHVGDCRLYLVQRSMGKLLTRDHTLATELGARGLESDLGEGISLGRHVLTRCLCPPSELAADFGSFPLEAGVRLLLVTDGVYPHFGQEELFRLSLEGTPLDAARSLVEAALDRSATDDRTACLLEFHQVPLP